MNIGEVCERWAQNVTGGPYRRVEYVGVRVFGRGATLYSYGTHFPMVEYHERTRARRRPLFLVNGDRVSVSTSRHQSDARAAVQRAAHRTGADVLIIPYSALAGAGILRDSIVPLEVRPDRWDHWAESVPGDYGAVQWSGERREDWPGGPIFETGTIPGNPDGSARRYWRHHDYGAGKFVDVDAPLAQLYHNGAAVLWDEAQGWSIERTRHWLGDSLFTGETIERRRIVRPVSVRDVVGAAVRSIESRRDGYSGILDIVETLDNVDVDTPIVETVDVRRRRRYISSFDANEPAPLYFLATLPTASRARTVAAAIDDLAPAAVHAAIARGRHVERQGDIFAIETDTHDAALAGFPRARLTQWTRNARPRAGEVGYVAPFTADERRRIVRRARALWRKRWDELQRGYAHGLRPANHRDWDRRRAVRRRAGIVAQLETARARARRAVLTFNRREQYAGYWASVNLGRQRESVDYLRLEAFRRTLDRGFGRDHYRRGRSIVPQTTALQLWRECVTQAERERRPALRPERQDRYRRQVRDTLSVHGTAHTATEVVRAPGGRIYIRGTMVHEPALVNENRERDHIRRPLKPGVWYLAVRNTVPRASTDTNGRRT